jgi:hypothetical protein
MKKLLFLCFISAFLGSSNLQALKGEALFDYSKEQPKIFINNRILADINGKPISTYDLMKKLDVSFFRSYPEFATSTQARSEFYEAMWKLGLEQMVDKELMLLDAKDSKIEVSAGDVRQEMEEVFGPNIIVNLEKAGLTFDEASKQMNEEIIIRRMLGGRVNMKALKVVTPKKIREAYQAYIQDPKNARLTQWRYRVITAKDRTPERTEALAQASYRLLMQGVTLEELSKELADKQLLGRRGKITVSTEIKHNEKELSKDYLKAINPLETGMISQPFSYKSRSTNTVVCRILCITERLPGGLPTYKEMENLLKDQLLDQAIEEETAVYVKKLHDYYHISTKDILDSLPADYQPFSLK